MSRNWEEITSAGFCFDTDGKKAKTLVITIQTTNQSSQARKLFLQSDLNKQEVGKGDATGWTRTPGGPSASRWWRALTQRLQEARPKRPSVAIKVMQQPEEGEEDQLVKSITEFRDSLTVLPFNNIKD